MFFVYVRAPCSSSGADNSEEFFDCLVTQITLYREMGPYCICGDFNARYGNLDDGCHQNSEISERRVTDQEHNTHGKQLINLLRSLGLCTLNGRGRENSTHISTTGSSVVDYCIVDAEDYNRYSSFAVKTMCEIIQTLDYNEVSHIPDQSLLTWHMDLEGVDVNSIHPHGPKQPP